MKHLIILAIAMLLFSCDKERGYSKTLEHETAFAAYALVQDTITLPDGRKAVLQEVCHTDTIVINTDTIVINTDTVVINTNTLAAVKTIVSGSSTPKIWPELETTFGIPIIRRAWGGYNILDIFNRVDTAITAKNPAQIIIYCGDNDLVNYNDSTIYARYKKLIDKITVQNPNALSLFISIKPNPSKPEYTSRIIGINNKIESYLSGRMNQKFVNTFPMMYSDGKINTAMYDPNGSVHLRNPQGYDAWEAFIKNYMIKN